jgi:hypothetical protein
VSRERTQKKPMGRGVARRLSGACYSPIQTSPLVSRVLDLPPPRIAPLHWSLPCARCRGSRGAPSPCIRAAVRDIGSRDCAFAAPQGHQIVAREVHS